MIDRDFRTQPGQRQTGIMGSSMGGLISLYAFFHYPEVFGFAGVMSPSLWVARSAIYSYVENAPFVPGRIYLDAGTRELSSAETRSVVQHVRSRGYYAGVRRLYRLLVRRGYRPIQEILYVEEKWAGHNESAWARRLPRAIRFFLEGDR
jgi:predicted alpha/beta superfamily hydrolase